ncbi:hypothetical protein BU26DRAFT_517763 [Trematosphaeria pertusa]|uniref:Uncharacterized protein n=1 Tax=Trematosphaeria pertusa TaxID=390896 RepID=A0A6A6IK82_9PLEO|nr:uncharacterized protein BU26DRAFT_517763 [Trematosphaeria pertusa]KAF2251015.1 hypothetical protein BU26DRAFT_517763 [Trematosphaeria pertusa]
MQDRFHTRSEPRMYNTSNFGMNTIRDSMITCAIPRYGRRGSSSQIRVVQAIFIAVLITKELMHQYFLAH